MKIITIGRDDSCDIVLSDSRISRIHANLIEQNGYLIYRDMSTNGTLINGIKLHHGEMAVNYGDSILLASAMALPWHKIQNLLQQNRNYDNRPSASFVESNQNGSYTYRENKQPDHLNRWNWGAFYFSWLWGVCNGVYWPLLMFIPVIGWITIPFIVIYLGVKGNELAWQKRKWDSAEHFTATQHKWAVAALCMFILSLFSFFFSLSFFLSMEL